MSTILLALLIGFVITVLANVCTTVYLHRAAAHRALTLRAPATHTFRFLVWISTGIRPRQWVAVHRKHHAHTDTVDDPHSPAVHGWVAVQMKNVAMYRREAQNPETLAKYAKDMPRTPLDRVLYDHALVGLGLGTVLLVAIFGWQVGLLAAFVHVNLYLGGSAAVNAIGHHFGRRRYDNSATNLHWLAFLTAGEGYHNNHHAAPTSARLSHRWYEPFDLGWVVIKVLTWSGLATVRLSGDKLTSEAPRADVRAAA